MIYGSLPPSSSPRSFPHVYPSSTLIALFVTFPCPIILPTKRPYCHRVLFLSFRTSDLTSTLSDTDFRVLATCVHTNDHPPSLYQVMDLMHTWHTFHTYQRCHICHNDHTYETFHLFNDNHHLQANHDSTSISQRQFTYRHYFRLSLDLNHAWVYRLPCVGCDPRCQITWRYFRLSMDLNHAFVYRFPCVGLDPRCQLSWRTQQLNTWYSCIIVPQV